VANAKRKLSRKHAKGTAVKSRPIGVVSKSGLIREPEGVDFVIGPGRTDGRTTALTSAWIRAHKNGVAVPVDYAIEPKFSAEEFIRVLVESTLAERRPVGDRAVIEGMLRKADVIVTARVEGLLVGVSRAISDFSYCTYLSDLAVDQRFQGQGIGRELIRRTHEAAGLHTTLILLAAPKAQTYYPHIGMSQHESCWVIPRQGAFS
jgi:GNAT superfamily N-acetyltransferase